MSVPQQRRRQRRRQGQHRQPCQIQPCIALIACCWLAVAQSWTSTSLVTSGAKSLKLYNPQGRRRCCCTRAAAGTAAMATDTPRRKRLVVIGGGAAGYFGAIQAAASCRELDVVVLEAGRLPLQKVKISGGGRCNVMHDTSKVFGGIGTIGGWAGWRLNARLSILGRSRPFFVRGVCGTRWCCVDRWHKRDGDAHHKAVD